MEEPLIIQERSRQIGIFKIGRLLPTAQKKTIGPFLFIDHMGPLEIDPEKPFEVGQHPHIGLATLTYLLAGSFEHKDSTGSIQTITPGDVNWMTAGRGIVHVEKYLHLQPKNNFNIIHGFQIWIALPLKMQDCEPAFHHSPKQNLPTWEHQGNHYTLIAGTAGAYTSPVPVYSPMFMLEVKCSNTGEFIAKDFLEGEVGVIIIAGSFEYQASKLEKNQLLFFSHAHFTLTLQPGCHLLMIGGAPLPEPRILDWNFAHTSQKRINEAIAKWNRREFVMIAGEHSYMPHPKNSTL